MKHVPWIFFYHGSKPLTIFTEKHWKKMKFFIKDLFNKRDQIRRKLRIWSNLLYKIINIKYFIFCVVKTPWQVHNKTLNTSLDQRIFTTIVIGTSSKEAYSEPSQTPKRELFAKIVNDSHPLTISAKRFILDARPLCMLCLHYI